MGLPRRPTATTATTDPHDDPMGSSRFHAVLVLTDRMQAIPAWGVALIIGGLALAVALVWDEPWVAAGYGAACMLNWAALWALPRLKRSYGPDRPSALALAGVNCVIVLALGVIGAPAWLPVLVLAGVFGVAMYSTWIEPFLLGVTRQTLVSPRYDPAARPLRLLHLADLHMEYPTAREARLQALIDELAPDVIVFSGDFVNISCTDDPRTFDAIRETIRQWRAPLGVYCVPGTYTVEPVERVQQFVAGLDHLTLLLDEWVTLDAPGGAVHLLGMVTTHRTDADNRTLERLLDAAPPGDGVKILLTHAPDVAYTADAGRIDLYLCGHTHGGQIRFPLIGAVFSGSALGMRFVMGRRDLSHTTVYTSRGIGLEGLGAPRARFLCPPEVILWQIQGGSN